MRVLRRVCVWHTVCVVCFIKPVVNCSSKGDFTFSRYPAITSRIIIAIHHHQLLLIGIARSNSNTDLNLLKDLYTYTYLC